MAEQVNLTGQGALMLTDDDITPINETPTLDQAAAVDAADPIDRRIAAVLMNDDAVSTDIERLIYEAKAAISATDKAIEAERERSLDPTLPVDAVKMQAALQVFELERDRLQAAVPRLQARLRQAEAREYARQWETDFKQVEAERNKLAEELTATYPEFVTKLVNLLNRIKEVDKEVDRVNGSAPSGDFRRLRGVELTARGLDRFTAANPSITDNLRLPDSANTASLIYPPPQINVLGLQMAAAASALAAKSAALYSADWAAARELEDQQKLEEAARRQAEIDHEEREKKRKFDLDLLEADRDRRVGRRRKVGQE